MGVPSDGSYGIPEGRDLRLPGHDRRTASTQIVKGLEIDEFSRERMDATLKELRGRARRREAPARQMRRERLREVPMQAQAPASAQP